MSLLKTIANVAKKAVGSKLLSIGANAIPGVGPVTAAVLTAASSAVGAKLASGGGGGKNRLPALPGGGGGGGGGGLPALVKKYGAVTDMEVEAVERMYRRRRRKKGITAKDLSSFKRVARLVDKYAKHVNHFRNIKK